MKEYREWIGFLLFVALVYVLCAGVDMGEPRDAGAPEGGL